MELWIPRNNTVHEHNNNATVSERTKCIHVELEWIYSKRTHYLNKDQDILLESVETHKALPVSSILNWLILYKSHLSESI